MDSSDEYWDGVDGAGGVEGRDSQALAGTLCLLILQFSFSGTAFRKAPSMSRNRTNATLPFLQASFVLYVTSAVHQ